MWTVPSKTRTLLMATTTPVADCRDYSQGRYGMLRGCWRPALGQERTCLGTSTRCVRARKARDVRPDSQLASPLHSEAALGFPSSFQFENLDLRTHPGVTSSVST